MNHLGNAPNRVRECYFCKKKKAIGFLNEALNVPGALANPYLQGRFELSFAEQ
jgi:hypothetical protein